MRQIVSGIRDLGRGFAVLRAHPRLWKWLIAPAAITLALFGLAIFAVVRLVDPVVGWLASHLPAPLTRLVAWVVPSALVTTVVAVALSIGAVFVFVSVTGLIAGPFNERLSEHIEVELTGRPGAAFSLPGFVRGVAVSVGHSVRRLLAGLVGLILVFALGLVPVFGTIAALLLAGWLAAGAAAYDCYDAVLARRELAYRDKLAYLARHRQRAYGLGAGVAVMLLIPGLNLVALGLGAAAATVAARAIDQDRPPR